MSIVDDNYNDKLYLARVGCEMKRYMFCMIFLSSSILVFSQNRADTTLYIAPIEGGSPTNQAFFAENIKMEVVAAGYNVIDDILNAIYSISGSMFPEDDGNVLSITLSNVAEHRDMVTQELFFIQPEESYEVLPFLVWQMLANAPFLVTEAPPAPRPTVANMDGNASRMTPIVNLINAVPDDDTWKNKWIYLGAKFGPALQFYMAGSTDYNKANDLEDIQIFTAAVGLEASVQALDFLSIQTEIVFSLDSADYRNLKQKSAGAAPDDHVYQSSYLYFPLIVKGLLKPGRVFFLEPYGGAYLNAGLSGDIQLPIGGWLAGVDFGFKVGSGVLFIDFRYATDFFDSTVAGGNFGGLVEFRRHTATVSAGYKIGFLNRKQSATRFRGARY
jgi:hypothetical protein